MGCFVDVGGGRERDSPLHVTGGSRRRRSEEHTSELQSPCNLVCRLLLEKKKKEQALAKTAEHMHNGLPKIQHYYSGTKAVKASTRQAKSRTKKYEVPAFWQGVKDKVADS